ncbi:MAG: DUF4159 domain-containing protein [Candidatus Latescibacterota bacterium]
MPARHTFVMLTAVFLMHAGFVSARPNESSTAPSGSDAGKKIRLAEVWGEQLRTPASCARTIVNLSDALKKWTNLEPEVGERVMLASSDLESLPIIFLLTDQAFQLMGGEKQNLRKYVKSGGFLVLDNILTSQPRNQADAAFRQMIADLFGEGKIRPLLNNHEIYHSWFDFDGPPPGAVSPPSSNTTRPPSPGDKSPSYSSMQNSARMLAPSPTLDGVWVNGRLAGVISNRGYGLKWSAGIGNDTQLKMGVNFIAYALMQRAEMGGKK